MSESNKGKSIDEILEDQAKQRLEQYQDYLKKDDLPYKDRILYELQIERMEQEIKDRKRKQ